MAQGEFTKEEAAETEESFGTVFKSLSKQKKMDLICEANDIYLFLEAAKRAATDGHSSPVTTANETVGLDLILVSVANEYKRAGGLYSPLNSSHEAYAVILEELEEFWAEVQKRDRDRDKERMRVELVQVAAMAVRTIHDLDL
jgi:hypothetical protein